MAKPRCLVSNLSSSSRKSSARRVHKGRPAQEQAAIGAIKKTAKQCFLMPAFNRRADVPFSHRIPRVSVTSQLLAPFRQAEVMVRTAHWRRWREGNTDCSRNDAWPEARADETEFVQIRQRDFFRIRLRRCRASPIHCHADIPGPFPNTPWTLVGERRTVEEKLPWPSQPTL